MNYNAMCVKGHIVTAPQGTEVEKQCQLLDEGVIEAVDAIRAEDCEACRTAALIDSNPVVMEAREVTTESSTSI